MKKEGEIIASSSLLKIHLLDPVIIINMQQTFSSVLMQLHFEASHEC